MSSDNFCRLCLRLTPMLCPMFSDNRAEMLEILTSIKVVETDPCMQMCLTCLCNLKLAYKIQQDMREADMKFRKMWTQSQSSVKDSATNKAEIPCDFKLMKISSLVSACASDQASCSICGHFIGPGAESNEHIEKHFRDSKICHICEDNQSFITFSEYRQHMVNSHRPSPGYKCGTCNTTFFYKTLYNIHRKNAHPQLQGKRKPIDYKTTGDEAKSKSSKIVSALVTDQARKMIGSFVCPHCKKTLKDRFTYTRHVHGHKKRPCTICARDIGVLNMSHHMKRHFAKPETYICEMCGAKLTSHASHYRHVRDVHGDKEKMRFKCDRCDAEFREKRRLDIHFRRAHEDNAKFICDTCGKRFYALQNMKVHIEMIHLRTRQRACDVCDRVFATLHTLVLHKRRHTLEKPHSCDMCPASFTQPGTLKNHKKKIHKVVDAITVSCKKCGKGFATDRGLSCHTAVCSKK